MEEQAAKLQAKHIKEEKKRKRKQWLAKEISMVAAIADIQRLAKVLRLVANALM